MQTKKGFTLIELLAVIVILAIIFLIATPIALNVIGKAKENAFKNTAYGLIDTIKLKHSEDYLNGVEEDKIYVFPEAEGLKYAGEKPKGGSIRLTKDGKVSIAIHNEKWCITKGVEESEVTIKDYVDGKCMLPEVADIPVINLNGNSSMYLSIGKAFTDPGVYVQTMSGEVLSSSDVITKIINRGTKEEVIEIDTSVEGTYEITYSISYEGNTASTTRTVHVGNYKPTIKIEPDGTSGYSKSTEVTISVNAFEQYSINGFSYIVTKDENEIINTNAVENTKKINLTENGTYTIKVMATDSEGNISEYISEPYNIDVTYPEIIFEEGDSAEITLKVSEVATYDLKTGVNITDNNEITLDDLEVSGSLSAVVGEYIITYSVSDKAGNIATKTRKIIVEYPSIPDVMRTSNEVASLDPDGNLRYVGPDPDNYVWFNNELWRIIGAFGDQAKIIKNDYYSTEIAWDSTTSNNWKTATLQVELNGTYLSSIQTNDPESYGYIDLEYVWNIGGTPLTPYQWTRETMYGYERESTAAGASGSEATWEGAIGIIYPSDYGYSTSGDITTCNTTMYSWRTDENETAFTECAQKSWLYDSSQSQWTLTPHSDYSTHVHVISTDGFVGDYYVNRTSATKPVLYLKPNIVITGGKGTDTEPFQLGS